MSTRYCLVMAGGKGTRFWPESTGKRPKQYLKLVGDSSLLEQTLTRFEGLIPPDQRFVITINDQIDLVKDNSRNQIGKEGIILEPSGRNTAPCIMLAMARLIAEGAKESDMAAVVPSDHIILNKKGFQKTIDSAFGLCAEGKIVTIGIRPSFPHTGYGYIQKGEEFNGAFQAKEFKEKPELELAIKYLASGDFLWNAGMFVAPIGLFIEELKTHAPDMFKYFDQLIENIHNQEKLAEIYSNIPKDSIDYAVMEKSNNVLVIPADFDWNDLGSWDALESVVEEVEKNTLVSSKGHYFEQAAGNIIYTPDKFVGLINVQDLIVVCNKNAVVVLPKSDSQKVKKIVETLKKSTEFSDLV